MAVLLSLDGPAKLGSLVKVESTKHTASTHFWRCFDHSCIQLSKLFLALRDANSDVGKVKKRKECEGTAHLSRSSDESQQMSVGLIYSPLSKLHMVY